jgi:GTP cyclohydrolase I
MTDDFVQMDLGLAIHVNGVRTDASMTLMERWDERFPGANEVERTAAFLISQLGGNIMDENLAETPRRVVTYLRGHFRPREEVDREISELARAVFPTSYDEMLIERDIHCHGICPHHLLPVEYTVNVGYITQGRVVGLSKLARVPMLLCGLPLLQEELTDQIADFTQVITQAQDVAVVVTGQHLCMVVRGVEQHASTTVTSSMRGRFLTNTNSCKTEFLSLVRP